MIIPAETQISLLLFSILAGIITGILFDIYRLFRGIGHPNKILTFIEDLLFWILASLIVFVFLLYTRYIYIGIYVYMYISLGLYIYLKLISKIFLRVQYRIIVLLSSVLRISKNFILYPFQIIFHKISTKSKKIKKK